MYYVPQWNVFWANKYRRGGEKCEEEQKTNEICTDECACHSRQVSLLMVLLRSGDCHCFQTVSVFVGELLVANQ